MKKFIKSLILIILIIFFVGTIKINAHQNVLNVNYDNCIPENYVNTNNNGDGIDEKWYDLIWYNGQLNSYISNHIPANITQLKYYIQNDDPQFWGDMIEQNGINILNKIIEGINVWNNTYFYDYNANNNITTKNKIIKLVEGNQNDYNIIIMKDDLDNQFGATKALSEGLIDSEYLYDENYYHRHYDKWRIRIDPNEIFNATNSYDYIKRTISHELGHVLGLCDVDQNENYNISNNYHHEELLMGYSKNLNVEARQRNLTYKDLAGVAITRGFHTDNDHKWLNMGIQENGEFKLICSICNGVVNVLNIENYSFYNYGECNNNHTLQSNNMMAVGCIDNKDFIKCKYCRYVAPVENMVIQNNTISTFPITHNNYNKQHIITNNINGLNYTIYESHNFSYTYHDQSYHKAECACGFINYYRHTITEEDYTDGNNFAICLQCKRKIFLDDDMFPVLPDNIIKYSINGSFILPNGIIILKEPDIEFFLNGLLIFYNIDEIPQII